MRTSEPSAVKSAGRTLDLLEFFARAEVPQSFRAVSRALEIPPSSLSQLIATLCDRGYLEHVGGRGGYRAGPGLDALLVRLSAGRSIIEQARPLLLDLRDSLGESVGLNVLRGDETEVAAAEHAEGELTYRIRVGATAPLYVVAAGKALLAAMADPAVDAYIARTRFTAFTSATVRSGAQLWRDIKKIRTTGFAHSIAEASPGVAGVARALMRGGQAVAALTVGLPAIRYDEAADARIRQALLIAADRFEASAGRGR